jgi:hypothetical protein
VIRAAGVAAVLAATMSGCGGSAGNLASGTAPPAERAASAPLESGPTQAAGTAEADGSGGPAAPKSATARLSGAAPDEHSEVGDLVDGFPIDLLPVPSDSVILVTSAVPVGDADVQEVSLNLRTSAEAADLLALYREALTTAGFTEVPPPAGQTDLAAESTFTRSGGDELITIGVLDVAGARTVSVGGRVHTGS